MPGQRGDVLVVDDDPLVRKALVLRLELWGFGARTARDVASAEELLAGWEPAAALVDLVLPGRSGLDFLRDVKRRHGDLPVVLISAHGGLREAREALVEGAEDVLSKPLRPERLRVVLDTVTAGGTRSAPLPSPDSRPDAPSSGEGGGGSSVTGELPVGKWARRAEGQLLVEMLERTEGDEAEAARRLNVPVWILRRKLARYG